MKPEEIKPDTQLCTILGYNAQTGKCRKYFNGCLKTNEINATAIALNIKDEHFHYTMSNLADSKVTKMIFEEEFRENVVEYCDELNPCAKKKKSIDFVEVENGKIMGYCLDDVIEKYIDNPEFMDERIRLAMKMMVLSNRWYGAKIDMDLVPTML
jgi:shikimate 5-dehydrogenase